MLEAYRARQWSAALSLHNENSAMTEKYRLTKTYQTYAERIAAFQSEDPGADWDGVFEATNK
ncbi:hypothetical protein C8024_18620 [Sphingopyxis sp. BSNA05]|nr:hypothetical protein [Sphingopyxis sp. BSNA05]